MPDLPARARVVIVGGGVTGCSIAYHLAHLGWTDIVLLEQNRLTAGTTWHAAGLITSAGMTDETALFFSRYSRDLYARLEAETGHSTGFRPVGHISLATSQERQAALRREAAWMHGFGVEDTEISPRELAEMWPLARTDDVLSAFYVADEGRADPVGVATALAKGARQLGATVIEGIAATGVTIRRGRVAGVRTEQGEIETEVVVNAAGMWARQFGALAGVSVPLQAAEHYYLLTDTVPGMDADLAVIEDPDSYGYYRPEGDGMLVGLFEPVGAPWSLDGVARDFAFGKLPPDWDRMEPYLGTAMERIPVLAQTGVRTFFCGPESFTADIRPLLGPAPEVDGYYVAAGLNSLGILSGGGVGNMIAHWIVDGVPPVDATAVAIDRTATYETSRKFRSQRTPELLGVLFGDAVWPAWQPKTGRNVRRSVLHDRLDAAGAHWGVSAGWEFPEWFAPPGQHPAPVMAYRRQASHDIVGAEHRAIREAVGVIDMSLMAKLIVQGPDAAAVLSRLSTADVARETGRLVYTQWLNTAGGIVADVTVTRLAETRFMVVASDIIHRRIEPLIRRETRPDEIVTVTDVTSGTTLLTVQGPASRELISRLTDSELSNEEFGYLTARPLYAGFAPTLAMRVTYVGELGWELHVPAEYAAGVYDDLTVRRGRPGPAPGRPGRDVEPAAGKGLPGHGHRHRQHRQPHRGRPRLRGGLGQARRLHRPGRPARGPGRGTAEAPGRRPDDRGPGRGPVRQRARVRGRTLGRLRAGGRLRLHGRRPGRARPGRLRGRRDRRVAEGRRLHRPRRRARMAGPAADRAVLRPEAAAHPRRGLTTLRVLQASTRGLQASTWIVRASTRFRRSKSVVTHISAARPRH